LLITVSFSALAEDRSNETELLDRELDNIIRAANEGVKDLDFGDSGACPSQT
jgi:hypothetical protein